jgi:hypothetical protein
MRRSRAQDVGLLRLIAQGIVGPRRNQPREAAERMLALQAQEQWSGLASLTARSTSRQQSDVLAALDAGELVRSWTLRGTLHLTAADDLRWMLRLLAPRQLARAATREARLGITAGELDRAKQIAVEELSARGPTSRADVIARWRASGLDTGDQRSYHLIWHLAHDGVVCLGPIRAGQQQLVLVDDWVAASPLFEREEALGELARRYFDSHGPATAADLKRWANLTAKETQLAIALARCKLSTLEIEGVEHLLGPTTQDELADCRREARGVFALPGFDELLFGYRDRSATLPERYAAQVLRANAVGRCTIIFDGRVIGTWKRPRHGTEAKIEQVAPLEHLPAAILRSAASQVAELVS